MLPFSEARMIAAMTDSERLIVALDLSTRAEILAMADELRGVAGMMKIGLQAFIANGPAMVAEMKSRGHRVFLDLKLHDIPNTVSSAVKEAAKLGADLLTVHASGGERMISSARAAVEGTSTRILAVTLLTSLNDDEAKGVGFVRRVEEQVTLLAELSQRAGAHGVVASPLEIESLRAAAPSPFLIVTPGIRGASDEAGDQQRTLTASEAVRRGADYIVVGRPITRADSPRRAAQQIFS
jgi:orotidine-5'-phosphate decarboxylase